MMMMNLLHEEEEEEEAEEPLAQKGTLKGVTSILIQYRVLLFIFCADERFKERQVYETEDHKTKSHKKHHKLKI